VGANAELFTRAREQQRGPRAKPTQRRHPNAECRHSSALSGRLGTLS
jgi:hypothetical protein